MQIHRKKWRNEMMFYQPILFTGFLLLLSSSGLQIYTSLTVFGITIIVTYVCYSLKTQLKLEHLIKHILKIPTNDEKNLSDVDYKKRLSLGLETFPKPIAKILRKYIDGVLKDFVKTWYIYIGPDEEQFLKEVENTLEIVFLQIFFRLEKIELRKVVVELIQTFQIHVKVFDDCRNIVLRKYPTIHKDDYAHCMFQLYEAAINRHVATYSKGMEINHIKSVLDIIFYKFLPCDTFSCEGGRFMLREVLATKLIEPIVKDFTDPYFVNEALIDILEPSVPLPIVIKAFNDAEVKIERENSKTLLVESEQEEESTHESCSICSKEETNEKLQKLDSNLSTPSKEKRRKDFLQNENFTNSNDDLLRFDNLDRKRSAPVYGSKSARDHEKNKKHGKYESSISDISEIRENEQKLGSAVDISTINKTENPIFPSPPLVSGWAVCPPSTDSVFRKESFSKMPKQQDDISERVVAKLNSFGPILLPTSCLDTCGPLKSAVHKKPLIQPFPPSKNKKTDNEEKIVSNEKKEKSLASECSDESIKYHKSGKEGTFYEMAPSCPTCIEMTYLASPFENERAKPILYEKDVSFEHECGLQSGHFFCPQTDQEPSVSEEFDDQSFASCHDIEEILNESVSSGTLLASGESTDIGVMEKKKLDSSESYDILSSLSETSNLSDYISSSALSEDSSCDLSSLKGHRSQSITTYKTALEHSISSYIEDRKHSKKTPTKISHSNQLINFFKYSIPLISKKNKKSKREKSKHKHKHKHRSHHHHHKPSKNIKIYSRRKRLSSEQSENQSLSTVFTKFKSIPDSNSGPLSSNWTKPEISGRFIEEVAHEVLEDDDEQYLEEFQDANAQFYSSSPDSALPVDPLSKEIAVTDKDLIVDSKSVKSVKSSKSTESKHSEEKTNQNFIPIYHGEVIMPHPSKLLAPWQYPIQMISIPSTEVAYEKGWEPGINKYTLYSIHYDIRIWPDLYQRQLEEAREKNNGEDVQTDHFPVIREIKRRYREFLYLHNRFTHGVFSKFMKGILRPNRRYAMPFGRMDPDVIEGRRKILETYLVSIVSRPELCNSREFKDFLGSVEESAAVLKAKDIAERQVNSMVSTVKTEQSAVLKEERLEKGINTPYFIHGYEVPRMFGYADDESLKPHCIIWFSHYAENYFTFQANLETRSVKEMSIIASFEPIQKPRIYLPTSSSTSTLNERASQVTLDQLDYVTSSELGVRTSGDGSEHPDGLLPHEKNVRFDDSAKKHDGRTPYNDKMRSLQIAAKFSEELASQLQEERERLAIDIAYEKDMYQSSWPLTDAVFSIACQALKGFGSWLTFASVQQAILFSLGGLVEWLIGRELDEVIMKERCYKYLVDLYNIIWDERDELRPAKPEPSSAERERMKKEALERLKDIIPNVVIWSIGRNSFDVCCRNLLDTLQYQNINKHVLYALLDVILMELVPELKHEFPTYVKDAIHRNRAM